VFFANTNTVLDTGVTNTAPAAPAAGAVLQRIQNSLSTAPANKAKQ